MNRYYDTINYFDDGSNHMRYKVDMVQQKFSETVEYLGHLIESHTYGYVYKLTVSGGLLY